MCNAAPGQPRTASELRLPRSLAVAEDPNVGHAAERLFGEPATPRAVERFVAFARRVAAAHARRAPEA